MRLVSPLLKRVVYPGLSQTGYLRRYARNGQLCVVTYHGVRPAGYRSRDAALDGSLVSGSTLRRQLRLLKSRYNIVTPDEFLQWIQLKAELPSRALLLSCDDGLKNTLTEMVPILREEGVSCLFFVTGASAGDDPGMLWYEELYLMLVAAPSALLELEELGVREMLRERDQRRGLWSKMVKRLSQYDGAQRAVVMDRVRERCGLPAEWSSADWDDSARRQRFWRLNASELRELAASGMSIGAHTLSHPALPEAPDELAWAEISASRSLLECALGTRVWALAYPFGDPASVTAREVRMAKEAGFACAFVNFGGGFGAELPVFAMPRVHVTADMTLGEFEAHVSGFYRGLRQSLAQGETTGGSQR
jgi:peptidoglycan/xylan/chitin deacetylase (PgdA/CDA1 family)